MANQNDKILKNVADYYATKLATYGASPQGVDWNGTEGQILRFAQLCRVIRTEGDFSVNDLGCGYGALLDYLTSEFTGFQYAGWDVSAEMISAARTQFAEMSQATFHVASSPAQAADYGIASGIFNVRLHYDESEWKSYMEATLDVLDQTSRRGFAFNCLTAYSDPDKMRQGLHYADPCVIFDLCKRRYSRHVALLHDYGLYEFTILVRKQL